jgi:hypothetical protein
VTAHAAELFAAAEGHAGCDDAWLRSHAESLASLFEKAIQRGSVRRSQKTSVVVDDPHVFFFQEDRLHYYINRYMRLDYGGLRSDNQSEGVAVAADDPGSHGLAEE